MKYRIAFFLLITSKLLVAQSATQNYIRTTVYPNGKDTSSVSGLSVNEWPNSAPQSSMGYFNGFAQEMQTQALSDRSGYVILSQKFYDLKGRLIVGSKPLEMINDSLNFKSLSLSNFAQDSSFERIIYDAADRLSQRMPYGAAWHNAGHAQRMNYWNDTTLKAMVSETTDEDGQSTRVYTDLWGRKIRQETEMGANPDLITTFEYDALGNLVSSMAPRAYVNSETSKNTTAFKYNTRNQLIEKISPDEDTVKYIYDLKGQLRFVQDANHRKNFVFNNKRSYWTYYKYDGLGRMIEQGELIKNYALDTLTRKATTLRYSADYSVSHADCDTVIRDSIVCVDSRARKDHDEALPPGGGLTCDTIPFTFIYCNADTTFSYTALDTLYGARSFPTDTDSILKTVSNQYDTYATGWQISIPTTDTAASNPIGSSPKTRLTRTKIFDANSNNWPEEAYVYDKYGRVNLRYVYIPELVQTKKFQYYYDASGRVLKTMYQDGQSDAFYQWFKYDNLSRLDSVFSSRTNNRTTATREAAYDYDNNHGGKILQTKIGNNSQQVDYTYNTRDWLKTVTSNQFSELLKYDDTTVNARYNGNIAQMSWITAGSPGAYSFTYDKANRLTDAVSVSPVTFSLQNQNLSGTYTNSTGDSTYLKDITISAGSNVTIQSHTSMRLQAGFTSNGSTVSLKPGVITAGTGGGYGDYSEKNITYDANGNIKTLTRSTTAAMVYAYDANKPNRLNSVSGGLGASYTYDNNGNMLRDGKNKIGYDYRNMPITDTLVNGKIVRFAYDAGGQRIKYLRYSGATLLDSSKIFILNGGKIIAEYMRRGASWRLEHYNVYGNELIGKLDSLNIRYYNLSDHLGSVRVTLTETGVVDSWSDYYPFGKESRGSSTVNEPKEQFTGKERDSESGLDYFGARYYNSEIGRWVSGDPLSGKYPNLSPYNYAANNPILLVDPNGKEIVIAGSKEFQQKVRDDLQKLTNDKLTLKDGTIYIAKLGTENSGNDFKVGTNLIRSLNKKGVDEHTFIITEGENNITLSLSNDASVEGVGSDAEIIYNPDKTEGGIDINGSTTRPPEIGLGHELFHAADANEGKRNTATATDVYDPDPANFGGKVSVGEKKTRYNENTLRKERGVPARQVPKKKEREEK